MSVDIWISLWNWCWPTERNKEKPIMSSGKKRGIPAAWIPRLFALLACVSVLLFIYGVYLTPVKPQDAVTLITVGILGLAPGLVGFFAARR